MNIYTGMEMLEPAPATAKMTSRSAVLIDTLLTLHQERDPQSVATTLLRRLEPEFGSGAVVCYMLDHIDGEFRLSALDDASGEVARRLRRADLRVPLLVPYATLAPRIVQLTDRGDPVQVIERVPSIIDELWGEGARDIVERTLNVSNTIVAPVNGVIGTVGLLMLFAPEGWPIDIAAECTAHAATAMANIRERLGALETPGRDPETGLHVRDYVEQMAVREINRAERYRRTVSLAVIDLPKLREVDDMRQLLTALNREVRLPDTVGRLDSSRLVAVLPETTRQGSTAFVNRLRAKLGDDFPLTCGVATYPQDGLLWSEVLEVAVDRLLNPRHEPTPIPGAQPRGSLRAAFPSKKGTAQGPFRG